MKFRRRQFLQFSATAIAAAASSRCAWAQAYPNRPVRLIVPFAAGGPSDAAARILGRALSKSIGQPMVIDNIPGANGAIAGRAVINAPADGYTFLWGVGSMVAIPLLQKSPPFEAFSNFTPVSMVGQFPFGMLTHPSVPAKTVNEFIAYARANSDKLSYASATLSEYMAAAQFMKASGVAMNRVPYKGNAQAMPDLLAGRIQVYFTPISLALPYVNDGRLRMLGALLPQRSPAVPDVPTMTEVGMPGVSIPGWQAIFAPPKTPQGIVDTMSRQINMALQDPEVAAQFDRLTLRVERSTPEILAAIIGRDAESWRVFIHENNIVQD